MSQKQGDTEARTREGPAALSDDLVMYVDLEQESNGAKRERTTNAIAEGSSLRMYDTPGDKIDDAPGASHSGTGNGRIAKEHGRYPASSHNANDSASDQAVQHSSQSNVADQSMHDKASIEAMIGTQGSAKDSDDEGAQDLVEQPPLDSGHNSIELAGKGTDADAVDDDSSVQIHKQDKDVEMIDAVAGTSGEGEDDDEHRGQSSTKSSSPKSVRGRRAGRGGRAARGGRGRGRARGTAQLNHSSRSTRSQAGSSSRQQLDEDAGMEEESDITDLTDLTDQLSSVQEPGSSASITTRKASRPVQSSYETRSAGGSSLTSAPKTKAFTSSDKVIKEEQHAEGRGPVKMESDSAVEEPELPTTKRNTRKRAAKQEAPSEKKEDTKPQTKKARPTRGTASHKTMKTSETDKEESEPEVEPETKPKATKKGAKPKAPKKEESDMEEDDKQIEEEGKKNVRPRASASSSSKSGKVSWMDKLPQPYPPKGKDRKQPDNDDYLAVWLRIFSSFDQWVPGQAVAANKYQWLEKEMGITTKHQYGHGEHIRASYTSFVKNVLLFVQGGCKDKIKVPSAPTEDKKKIKWDRVVRLVFESHKPAWNELRAERQLGSKGNEQLRQATTAVLGKIEKAIEKK